MQSPVYATYRSVYKIMYVCLHTCGRVRQKMFLRTRFDKSLTRTSCPKGAEQPVGMQDPVSISEKIAMFACKCYYIVSLGMSKRDVFMSLSCVFNPWLDFYYDKVIHSHSYRCMCLTIFIDTCHKCVAIVMHTTAF